MCVKGMGWAALLVQMIRVGIFGMINFDPGPEVGEEIGYMNNCQKSILGGENSRMLSGEPAWVQQLGYL